ncbi:hypothetical protein GmHk_14G040880 [Glycine max]|nr:hypothetical protein GmHk_14G040880 [Glycine max]
MLQKVYLTSNSNVGGGFRSRLNHYLYSGDKKHVFIGLTLITAVFTVPWFLMNRGYRSVKGQRR